MRDDLPLVSCIMPTYGRAEFALQSVRYFQRQQYPARELIIVDDSDDGLQARLPADPAIRYLRLGQRELMATKRNIACEQAQGAIIAQWDDDDWYGPQRLSVQIAPLLANTADISGLRFGLFFDLDRWAFWDVDEELHRRLFVGDIHGGTLVFWRRFWQQGARYPIAKHASDVGLLRAVLALDGRLVGVDGRDHFVYLRHSTNTWRLTPGHHLNPHGWQQTEEPALPPEDRTFYAARSRALSIEAGTWPKVRATSTIEANSDTTAPLVSCIMPTFNRRRFVPLAIHCFLNQDHPNRELIIVDDGDDKIGDLVPNDPRIRYIALETRHSLGVKRNLACDLARGSTIIHWDDDDWSAPRRVRYQHNQLMRQHADFGLICRTYHVQPEINAAWLRAYPLTLRANRAGGTLCYRRALWERNPFMDISLGEDTQFIRRARGAACTIMADATFYIAFIHGSNTSWKSRSGPHWHPRPLTEIQRMMGPDWRFYAPGANHH